MYQHNRYIKNRLCSYLCFISALGLLYAMLCAPLCAFNDKSPEGERDQKPHSFTKDYVIEAIYQELHPVLSTDHTFAPELDSIIEQSYAQRSKIKEDAAIFNILTRSILTFSVRGRQTICIELISRVLPYYQQEQKNGNPEMTYYLGRLYVMLGAGYEEVGFWRQALNIYRKAMNMVEEKSFTEAEPVRSAEIRAMLFNNIANIHLKQSDYNKAVSFYTKAIDINTKLKAEDELLNNYNNMGEVEIMRGNLNKAVEYAFLAQQQIDIEKDPYNYYFIQCNISQIYLLQNKPDIAMAHLSDGLAYMQKSGHDMDYGYGCLLAANLCKKKNDKARQWHYLSEAERVCERLNNQMLSANVYQCLSDYYHDNGATEKAYRYLKKSYALNDSIRILDDAKRLADMELVYEMDKVVQENSLLRKENELKDANIKRQRLIFILIGIIVVMVSALIVYRFQTQRKRRLEEQRIAEQREELNRKELEILRKREDSLKNELEIKNRELTSKVLKLVRNNEFIIHLTEELKQLLLELNPRESAKKEHIREMIAHLRSQSNDNSDTEFKYYFEQVYSSFYDNLLRQYPQLTSKDLRICAFLRLGLSTKEIAIITFREIRSVESSRNRLRKKMNIPADADLTEFFSHF